MGQVLSKMGRSLAELYLVMAAVENELNGDYWELPLIGESKDDADSGFIYLAVPKSARSRCQCSFRSKFPGFKSRWTKFLFLKKHKIYTIYAT